MSEEISLGKGQPTRPEQQPQVAATQASGKSLKELAKEAQSDADLVDLVVNASIETVMPWEETALPSKGIYYGWSSGQIKVRPWNASVDRALANQRLVQSGQAVNLMLKNCCKFPDGFKAKDLLVGDQVFLLYYLRGITHGNMYEFATTCPNQSCKTVNTNTADLSQLSSTIIHADEGLGKEPFKVVLPYLSSKLGREFWVSIRFMRVHDTQTIARNRVIDERMKGGTVRFSKSKDGNDRNWSLDDDEDEKIPLFDPDDILMKNLEVVITDIMGQRDPFKVRQFVAKMHSTDLAVVREWLAAHSPGIQTQIDITCPNCRTDYKVMLPITEGFFRPKDI